MYRHSMMIYDMCVCVYFSDNHSYLICSFCGMKSRKEHVKGHAYIKRNASRWTNLHPLTQRPLNCVEPFSWTLTGSPGSRLRLRQGSFPSEWWDSQAWCWHMPTNSRVFFVTTNKRVMLSKLVHSNWFILASEQPESLVSSHLILQISISINSHWPTLINH